MKYDPTDKYYRRAKQDNYRARSAYKLKEIQKKYKIIKRDDTILDIGCAPGSWLQVAKKITKGRIVGVDLNTIKPIKGVIFVQGDITKKEIQEQIKSKYDVIISDIAPKTSGAKERDQYLSLELSRMSFNIAKKYLKKSGNFIVKTFQSQETEDLVKDMKKHFDLVKRYIPESTRKGSKEIYIIAKDFN